jgi:hypothetical protein
MENRFFVPASSRIKLKELMKDSDRAEGWNPLLPDERPKFKKWPSGLVVGWSSSESLQLQLNLLVFHRSLPIQTTTITGPSAWSDQEARDQGPEYRWKTQVCCPIEHSDIVPFRSGQKAHPVSSVVKNFELIQILRSFTWAGFPLQLPDPSHRSTLSSRQRHGLSCPQTFHHYENRWHNWSCSLPLSLTNILHSLLPIHILVSKMVMVYEYTMVYNLTSESFSPLKLPFWGTLQ